MKNVHTKEVILNPSISESVNMMILSYLSLLILKSLPIPQPKTLMRYLNSWLANNSVNLIPKEFLGTPLSANNA